MTMYSTGASSDISVLLVGACRVVRHRCLLEVLPIHRTASDPKCRRARPGPNHPGRGDSANRCHRTEDPWPAVAPARTHDHLTPIESPLGIQADPTQGRQGSWNEAGCSAHSTTRRASRRSRWCSAMREPARPCCSRRGSRHARELDAPGCPVTTRTPTRCASGPRSLRRSVASSPRSAPTHSTGSSSTVRWAWTPSVSSPMSCVPSSILSSS
jgi:hypothetical protein